MARRGKPRWGWELTHDTKDFSKREASVDVDWLAEQLNCKGQDQLLEIQNSVLLMLLRFYHEQFEEGGPSNEEVRSALSEVVKSATILSKNLEQLDERSKRLLSDGYQKLHDDGDHDFDEDELEHSAYLFLKHLSGTSNARFGMDTKILKAAVAALELPVEKKSRGPRPKMAIKTLIEDVAALIEEHCRDDALKGFYPDAISECFQGKIVKILEHILGNFAPELGMTNSAIGGQIRRTIGDLSR